jgi:hypothetical protein
MTIFWLFSSSYAWTDRETDIPKITVTFSKLQLRTHQKTWQIISFSVSWEWQAADIWLPLRSSVTIQTSVLRTFLFTAWNVALLFALSISNMKCVFLQLTSPCASCPQQIAQRAQYFSHSGCHLPALLLINLSSDAHRSSVLCLNCLACCMVLTRQSCSILPLHLHELVFVYLAVSQRCLLLTKD